MFDMSSYFNYFLDFHFQCTILEFKSYDNQVGRPSGIGLSDVEVAREVNSAYEASN